MPGLYRLTVRDKMEHVLLQLQKNLVTQVSTAQAMPVPGFVHLQEGSLDEIKIMGFQEIEKYETMKMDFQLRLRLSEVGTIMLVGASFRNWHKPTISADQLLLLGGNWRSFEVGLVKCENMKNLPSRYSAMSQSISLTITYLQQKMGPAWCDYIQKF